MASCSDNCTRTCQTAACGLDGLSTVCSDCARNCSGGCEGTCSNSCGTSGCGSGCSGGCTGCGTGCASTCTGTCSTVCARGCSNNCTGGCDNTCSGGCSKTCSTTCGSDGCSTTCSRACSNNCTGTCSGTCSGHCDNACTASAQMSIIDGLGSNVRAGNIIYTNDLNDIYNATVVELTRRGKASSINTTTISKGNYVLIKDIDNIFKNAAAINNSTANTRPSDNSISASNITTTVNFLKARMKENTKGSSKPK